MQWTHVRATAENCLVSVGRQDIKVVKILKVRIYERLTGVHR